jgi:Zn-dependent M28 family amino/carboxypeptidase
MRVRAWLAVIAGVSAALGVLGVWVVQPWVRTIPSSVPAADPERLARHVRKLSVELYPRSFDQFDQLERAAEYIGDEWRAVGVDVREQRFKVQESEFRNIVARFGPREGPLLVIGAHYDSHGYASEGAKRPGGFSPDTHTPGADDNASGVAGLIELARLLALRPPKRPVELVAYTLEEPPHFRTEHMGSAHHARQARVQGHPIELMVSLEMIGYFSNAEGSQTYPLRALHWLYPTRGDFIAIAGRLSDWRSTRRVKALMAGATPLPVASINAPSLLTGIDFSDHRSYWAEGFDALMVTDTAFYRNPNYHGAGDTHDRLDYARMARVVQGVLAVALAE